MDKEDKDFEQATLDKEYDARLKHYIRKDEEFNENWMKAYAYILEKYCAKELQIALKELPNYESDVVNNPINLLKEVRGLMHTPIKARYPFMSLTENLSNLLNIKQTENESLIEYLERFEQIKE